MKRLKNSDMGSVRIKSGRGSYRRSFRHQIKWGLHDNRGMGTIEIILIIVVLIGLVIIFKSQITAIVTSLFSRITSQTSTI